MALKNKVLALKYSMMGYVSLWFEVILRDVLSCLHKQKQSLWCGRVWGINRLYAGILGLLYGALTLILPKRVKANELRLGGGEPSTSYQVQGDTGVLNSQSPGYYLTNSVCERKNVWTLCGGPGCFLGLASGLLQSPRLWY